MNFRYFSLSTYQAKLVNLDLKTLLREIQGGHHIFAQLAIDLLGLNCVDFPLPWGLDPRQMLWPSLPIFVELWGHQWH